MRDKLIELVKDSLFRHIDYTHMLAENITDDLIENGVVIIDPQKYPPVTNRGIIDTVFGMPLDEVADMIKAKQEGRVFVLPYKVGELEQQPRPYEDEIMYSVPTAERK